MQPIDETEALEALEGVAANPDDPVFKTLVDVAGAELLRRFKDDPGTLPGTFVIKLYLDGQKALANNDIPEDDTRQPLSVLEIVESANISSDRKQQLLADEEGRLEGLLVRVRAAMSDQEGDGDE